MSGAEWVSIIAALVTLIAAIGACSVSIINAARQKENNQEAKESRFHIKSNLEDVKSQLSSADGKLDVIHVISNGRLSEALTRIGQLEELVKRLIETPPDLMDKEKERASKSIRSGQRVITEEII